MNKRVEFNRTDNNKNNESIAWILFHWLKSPYRHPFPVSVISKKREFSFLLPTEQKKLFVTSTHSKSEGQLFSSIVI